MAKLIYLTLASLDSYVADKDGKFDWWFDNAMVYVRYSAIAA
jgi:hypothetical protein